MVSDTTEYCQYIASIVTGVNEFHALATEWDALGSRGESYFTSQTYGWAAAAWDAIIRHSPHSLAIVTIRREGRLVCLWAFFIRRRLFVRRAEAIGFDRSEFGGPLVEKGCDPVLLCKMAWNTIRQRADTVMLSNLAEGSEVHSMMLQQPIRCGISRAAVWLDPSGVKDWPTLQATLISSKHRSAQRRCLRQIQAIGTAAFEHAQTTEQKLEALDWMLEEKRRWLATHHQRSDWLSSGTGRQFFAHCIFNGLGVETFLLKVNDRPIAGWLVTADTRRVDGIITVYDPAWGKYSPGLLLLDHCLQWAFDRRLEFSLGTFEYEYKKRYSNRRIIRWTFRIATTWRGIPDVIWHTLRPWTVYLSQRINTLRRKVLNRARPGPTPQPEQSPPAREP